MKLAYTAGPYRAKTLHGVMENIRAAELTAIDLWRIGFAVICPHKNTALLDGTLGEDDSHIWIEGDLVMLERCDCIVMIPGWERSEGARAEKEFAEDAKIPVFHWPMDKDELCMFRDEVYLDFDGCK